MDKWIQNFLEQAAAAKNARFHGADGNFENFGDLFVGKVFEVAQNYGASKNFRNLGQRVAHFGLHLVHLETFEGRSLAVFQVERGMLALFFGVYRNLLTMMTPAPAAMVESLPDADTVKPGFEGAAAAEIANTAKGAKENFLSNIGGVGAIGEDAVNQVVNAGVVVRDEPIESRLRTGLQLGDQLRLVVCPGQRLCEVGHAVRRDPPGCAHEKLDTGAP